MRLSLIFIKVTGWVAGALSKMKLRLSYFPVNFTKHLLHRKIQGNWFNYYLKHEIFEFLLFLSYLPSDYDHTNTF